MILNPRFYEIPPLSTGERAAEQKALGFDAGKPVGLVMFGGEGSAVMLQIARALEDRQLILICGKNTKLRDRLKALPHRAPIFVEGFTKEVPRYMQLADYFIGKPGPGSVSEARGDEAAGDCGAERVDACRRKHTTREWLRELGAGIVLPNFRGIAGAVDSCWSRRHTSATGRRRNGWRIGRCSR